MPRNFIRTFATVLLAVSPLSIAPVTHSAPALSASDILAKCAATYNALPNYECHTDVTSGPPGNEQYHCTADITFLRPGMIRVAGTNMVGSQYGFMSDGTNAFEFDFGAWKKVESTEIAIGGATGIAQGAATTIPALLLKTDWGYPFNNYDLASPNVTTQIVNGQPCYFIIVKQPIKQAFWVDKKTFLLDQVATNISMGSIHLKELQVITNSRYDPTLTSASFAAPANAQ